ncbi:unnamed protein product [Dibothriocephalus latus]|uniref:Uncharacterized protein n=1 Tax=Dibothriocephalus latus TaxID=60516 RepID=A0A3P7LRD3_DIBLA|nr:unnamed protein product [Dibothriocephalus latus]
MFDVPFTTTFMRVLRNLAVTVFEALHTLFLVVFSFCWVICSQPSPVAITTSAILETSAGLQIAILVLFIVSAAVGILLRYSYHRQELKDLQILASEIRIFKYILKVRHSNKNKKQSISP